MTGFDGWGVLTDKRKISPRLCNPHNLQNPHYFTIGRLSYRGGHKYYGDHIKVHNIYYL